MWRPAKKARGWPYSHSGALARGGVSDDDQVFVMRFWREREDEATALQLSRHWRARIIYVNDGRQFHAPGIDDAFELVRSLILNGKYQS
jgi:hypothetical protein